MKFDTEYNIFIQLNEYKDVAGELSFRPLCPGLKVSFPFQLRLRVMVYDCRIQDPSISIEVQLCTLYMIRSYNGNAFRVAGPLRGESSDHRWIPLTNTSNAQLMWHHRNDRFCQFHYMLNARMSCYSVSVVWVCQISMILMHTLLYAVTNVLSQRHNQSWYIL